MRRSPIAIALVMAMSLLAACGTTKTGSPAPSQPATTTSSPSTAPSTPDQPAHTPDSIPTELAPVPTRAAPLPATVPCEYPASTQSPPAKPNQPPPAGDVSAQGAVNVTMSLTNGDITMVLARALAPCTVNSFVSLAKQGYYDDTRCHRLTTSGIKVLQCGDPSGQGSGGPGYSFKDEVFPELKYGRGILAMANAGPDTNGSQFFIVYGEAPLPPKYTVFGTLDDKSMAKIDEIARAGTVSSGAYEGDGSPKNPVTIKRMVVAG